MSYICSLCMPIKRPLGACGSVLTAILLAGAVLPRSAAAATNLVQDPGFEVATSTTQASAGHSFDGGDWFATGNDAEAFDDAAFAHSGNNSADLTLFTTGGVKQTIGTTAGQIYTLSFYAATDYTGGTFDVLFDGVTVPGSPTTLPNNNTTFGATDYTGYTFNVTAPTTSSTLEFDATSQGNTLLDDVSLTPNNPPSNVPEPGSLALLALGLLPLGLAATRKKRAS